LEFLAGFASYYAVGAVWPNFYYTPITAGKDLAGTARVEAADGSEAERLGRLEIDDQIVLRRILYRQVARFFAL